MTFEWVAPPGWPDSVRVGYSTRDGGVSEPPYASFNLALHVGDEPARVHENRRRLLRLLPEATDVAWLDQVHGSRVADAGDSIDSPAQADASWTREPGLACAVMSADCLPVMLTDRSGSLVAAIHAGWRGLAAGVVDNTVAALPVPADTLLAFLGPAIGADAFEVGPEVMDAFLDGAAGGDASAATRSCFRPQSRSSDRLLADLRALAALRLENLGVHSIFQETDCTYGRPERFYSYRRDGVTGRMVTLICRLPAA